MTKAILVFTNLAALFAQGAYMLSPVDLIPDVLPIIGWTDDLFGLFATMAFTGYTVVWVYKERKRRLQLAETGEMEPPFTRVPVDGDYQPLSMEEIRAL